MSNLQIRHGFLYLADLNPRLGTEAGKVRPVLVIQNDFVNEAKHASTWILPCTTKLVGGNMLRAVLPEGIAGNQKACEVMIDQSRSIDNQRFKKKLKQVPTKIMSEIKDKLKQLGNL